MDIQCHEPRNLKISGLQLHLLKKSKRKAPAKASRWATLRAFLLKLFYGQGE